MEKRRITRNAITSVTQVMLSGVFLLVLYRYLLDTIGVEKMGIWSVVLATTSASRISELGLSGSVVKFVAKYIAQADAYKASGIVQTAAISIGVVLGVVLLIANPLLAWFLGFIIPSHALPDALSILPYALASLWITTIAGVFQSGLDGCQRIDLRNFIMIAGSVLYLLFVVLLVPGYGLIGLAYGQIAQAGTLLLASWFLLRRELSFLPIIPHRWRKDFFKEMILYGINFQIISIMGMLFEPMTKALLSKFGGLSMVGYFDMANRMIIQFRALLVSANQVLVPIIAGLQEIDPLRIKHIYKESCTLMTFLALPFYALIIAAMPFISEIWIGHYEQFFVIVGIALAVGWLINTLSAPSYFVYLGSGYLKWNTLSHIVMGGLNLISGYLLGLWIGGIGVVFGWILALVLGSVITLIAYHVENKIGIFELFDKNTLIVMLGCTFVIIFAFFMYYRFHGQVSVYILFVLYVLLFGMVVGPLLWRHPMRTSLIRFING